MALDGTWQAPRGSRAGRCSPLGTRIRAPGYAAGDDFRAPSLRVARLSPHRALLCESDRWDRFSAARSHETPLTVSCGALRRISAPHSIARAIWRITATDFAG